MTLTVSPLVFWIIVLALCLVIEACTLSLTTIWFAAGALIAMFLSFPVEQFRIQAAVFATVSSFCLFLLRPFAVRSFNTGREKTNTDLLPGKTAVVVNPVDNMAGGGRVSVDGNEWLARSVDGGVIGEGETVTICQVSGAALVVRRDGRPGAGKKEEKD